MDGSIGFMNGKLEDWASFPPLSCFSLYEPGICGTGAIDTLNQFSHFEFATITTVTWQRGNHTMKKAEKILEKYT